MSGNDSLGQYLTDICRYPLLNKAQEIMLARQVQAWLAVENPSPKAQRAGKRALDKLVNCNLRLVVSVAKRYNRRLKRSEMLDIIQEGNLGLAHGVKKFDPERGYALSTYVYWWIRQSISRYLNCYDRVIRLPSHAVEVLSKIQAWIPTFEQSHGRKPTFEECAEYSKTNPDRLRVYFDNSSDCGSLDVQLSDHNSALIDLVSDGDPDILGTMDYLVDPGYLQDLLSQLEPDDRTYVAAYYGVYGEAKSLAQIGRECGVSRERVRQRVQKALNKLRVFASRTSAF